ncbi:uncharacterized protein LOC121375690 [Gigantopelta aegis]|uniref:uncharacterized protein LOC121375690 n=1 Tax=Gigantopelta aegis TaxID=1735272 RepID=UPI001B8878C1|nr:uncharacterized protein LOC121375690 [Gigantopelta aegis]
MFGSERSFLERPCKPVVLGLKPEITKVERKKSTKLRPIWMNTNLAINGALCFTLSRVTASPEDVKDAIESQLGCVIDYLRFSSVGEADIEHKTMWVFTVKGGTLNRQALHHGIKINGKRSRIRYLDDVVRLEPNAYKMYRSIEDETLSKAFSWFMY